MAKYTLLGLTQSILRSIKGEEISAIDDTTESLAVVDIIKECYYNLVSNTDFPELYKLFELNASGDSEKPIQMTIPTHIVGMEWVKYNIDLSGTNPNYADMYYIPIKDYLERQNMLSSDEANVDSMEFASGQDTISVKFRTDKMPEYYTSPNDFTLLFDSHLLSADTTLQKVKTLCYGLTEGSWSQTDAFEFDLDAQQYDTLLKEAKAMAWQELKSIENAAALRSARKNRIKAEVKKFRSNYTKGGYYDQLYPHYGRK